VTRLLHVDPRSGRFSDAVIEDLPRLLAPGDLLVLNDAATLPASLSGTTGHGACIEVRLAARGVGGTWTGVVFGAGDWRMRTEDRPAPPPLTAGERIRFASDLAAVVTAVSGPGGRLLELSFELQGAAFWSALYRHGRAVQYSYLSRAVRLSHVQTAFASRPWAFEPPSAGRPLTWTLLRELGEAGVQLGTLTHAAGLSSIGDTEADRILPLPERFDIPTATVDALREVRTAGGRVVAVGTTVVRALEGAAAAGGLQPGEGITDLRIGAGFTPTVVDGLLTGLHEPGSSHFGLLLAFAPEGLLLAAHRHAEAAGYLAHEFGDSALVFAR
jgi:S-adenosylmethionine:tRNA ribosyltransferase-isomerase